MTARSPAGDPLAGEVGGTMSTGSKSSRWRTGALVLGAWTFVGAMSLASRTLTPLALGRPLPPPDVLASVLVSVWLWALLTPAIFALTERFPLDGTRWWRPIGPHLLLCAACWVADVGAGAAFGHFAASRQMPFAPQLFGGLFGNVFSYLGVLAVGQARRSHRISVERQVRASELESELLRSRLLALQMQLRPHFLFNALNTVSGLIRVGNNPTALQTVAGLADLLRAVLLQDGAQEVPLRDELEFIEQYLQIEGPAISGSPADAVRDRARGARRARASAALAAAGRERGSPRQLDRGGEPGRGPCPPRRRDAQARGARLRREDCREWASGRGSDRTRLGDRPVEHARPAGAALRRPASALAHA